MKVSPVALKLLPAARVVTLTIGYSLVALYLLHFFTLEKIREPLIPPMEFLILCTQAIAVIIFSDSIEKSLQRFERSGADFAIYHYYRKRLRSATSYPPVIIFLCSVAVANRIVPILLLALYPALVHAYYAVRFGRNSAQTIRVS